MPPGSLITSGVEAEVGSTIVTLPPLIRLQLNDIFEPTGKPSSVTVGVSVMVPSGLELKSNVCTGSWAITGALFAVESVT